MGNPTNELRAKLDELGIEWETPEERWNEDSITYWKVGNIKWVAFESENDTLWLSCNSITDVTPEQAIAATVEPNKAEEWQSVALGLFDSLEKADLDKALEWLCENDLLRQEIAYGDAKAATVGRSCASCPEMDNPDSYISHLQSALKWHDEHVPIPTNPHTCVVLQGKKPPEEILFVRDEGGVTHYLPESATTCKDLGGVGADGEAVFHCSECGCILSIYDKDGVNNLCTSFIYDYPRFCPECGRKIKKEAK